jgi:UDP-GlcNAc:undecaprenyl-phosphate/decaprenyl-phosphate GlcNAc-1-phosphate transferase
MNRTTLVSLLAAALGITLLLGLLFTALAIRVATRIGFVDRPGGHKSHAGIMPYGGGVAIFLAGCGPAAVALLLALTVSPDWILATFGEVAREYVGGLHDRAGQALIILLGALVLHILGIIDDRHPLKALPKLVTIVAVAALVSVFGGIHIATMWGQTASMALTVAWFVVIVNAFNFLDNMDGLSSGVAWICLAFFAICGLMAGQVLVPALACVFLGAIGGFWAFNFPPARIFMGDAGSLLVGYMLAVVSVMTTYYESSSHVPPYALAMPLVILAVPLYDFLSVITIRIAEGRNPMKGDQRHFSHRLVERGLSRRLAVMTIYLATATTGLAATLLPGANLPRTLTIGVLVLMVLAIVAILESPLRKET